MSSVIVALILEFILKNFFLPFKKAYVRICLEVVGLSVSGKNFLKKAGP